MRISDIFFTKRCIGCGRPIDILCDGNICDDCKPDFVSASDRLFYINGLEFMKTCFFYRGRVRAGIRRFKLGNDGYTGRILAENIAKMIENEPLFPKDCVIVSVPGNVKNTDRDYVQAGFLAKHAARLLKTAYYPDVVRKKSGAKSQTGCRSAAERRKNIKGSFRINGRAEELIAGKNIIIIDDISTTGATLSELSDILHAAGAKKIYGACAAKTPSPCGMGRTGIAVNPEKMNIIEVIKK